MTSASRFYGSVFLVCCVVMALQILQSRLFSVTTWYHLSFLVISIAMFGLTLGALKIYGSDEAAAREDYLLIARKSAFWFAVSIFLSLIVQLFFPLVSANPWQTFLLLPVVAISTGASYYCAGVIITVSLTRAPYPVGKIYGVDLFGAATGCLGALALMSVVDTPSGLVLIAMLAAVSGLMYQGGKGPVSARYKQYCLLASVYLGSVFCLNTVFTHPFLYPVWAKEKYAPQSLYQHDQWNAISRVTVEKEKISEEPFLWGPSDLIDRSLRTSYSFLKIDNDAGTPITRMDDGNLKAHSYLEYDITNLAYRLPALQNAAIIGLGGGRDVLSAKYFGVENVTAMDVNPIQVHLLRDHPFFSAYAGLKNLPGVDMLNSEARSWFRNNEKKFDLVQMSLIDTWAATGAGAFALSENGLYTREAWSVFFRDLSDSGVFTVSRWAVPGFIDDTARLLSLAVATLQSEGIQNPKSHIFMAASTRIVTIILSKSDFSSAQLDALHNTAEEKQFKILLSPRQENKNRLLKDILAAKNDAELQAVSAAQSFDVSPPTDMRPFFFNQAKFSNPLLIAKLALLGGPSIFFGQAKATFNLFLIIIFSAFMVGAVICVPIMRKMAKTTYPRLFVLNGALYFFLIGFGFMLVEVSLLQAFGVYLGNPTYGLGIVLFSLILSTGAGSFLSEKFSLDTTRRQLVWVLSVAGYVAVLAFALDTIFTAFAEVALIKRATISVVVLFPLGMLLGYGFPTGIKLVAARYTQSTSWFWGINGAAGVLGSALAIALNIALGIDYTLFIAGFVYLILILPMYALAQR